MSLKNTLTGAVVQLKEVMDYRGYTRYEVDNDFVTLRVWKTLGGTLLIRLKVLNSFVGEWRSSKADLEKTMEEVKAAAQRIAEGITDSLAGGNDGCCCRATTPAEQASQNLPGGRTRTE